MNQDINKPLVTVITVVYNGINTLEQTIKSVINQSYEFIEYIIIDGGSTDGSVELIKKYEHHLAHWVSESDSGIYDAMNKGLSLATGNVIGLLNSDDWYESDCVEQIVEAVCSNPEIDVIHGLLRFYNINGQPDLITGHYYDFLDKGMIEHPTCFIRKSLYAKIGFFDIKFRSAADYDWMQRARIVGAKFLLLPHVLANFRRGGMSDSLLGAKEELSLKKKYRLISKARYIYSRLYIAIAELKKKGH